MTWCGTSRKAYLSISFNLRRLDIAVGFGRRIPEATLDSVLQYQPRTNVDFAFFASSFADSLSYQDPWLS